MAKKPLNFASTFLIILLAMASAAMAQDSEEEKPKAGFVRILNAATINMREPGGAGLNLSFKDQPLAMDMRGGEAAGYRQIMFRGKDTVDFIATKTNQKVGSVPASFQKDCFYTLLVTGTITDSRFNLKPLVFKDFPIPDEKKPERMSLVRIFNGVDIFRVGIQLGEGQPTTIPPMTFKEVTLAPGEHKLKIIYNNRGKVKEMNSRLIVTAGSMFTVITMVCPETRDRPMITSWEDTYQMKAALENLKTIDEEKNPN
jgi:hypothetical protein